MKKHILYLANILILSLMLLGYTSCSDDEISPFQDEGKYPQPNIELSTGLSVVAVLDQHVNVKGKLESELGLRDAYITLMKDGDKGYEEIDKNKRTYLNIDKEIKSIDFDVNLLITTKDVDAVKIVVLNSVTKTTEQIIKIEKVVNKPNVSFLRNTDTRYAVVKGLPFTISGNINDKDSKIESLSFISVVSGVEQTPIMLDDAELGEGHNVDYAMAIPAVEGLEKVIVRVENEHKGTKELIYTIQNVLEEDFIFVELDKTSRSLSNILEQEENTLIYNFITGSDISSIKYVPIVSGSAGSSTTIELSSKTTLDGDIFELKVEGVQGLEGIQVTTTNIGGITKITDFVVPALTRRALYSQKLKMSTDPNGNTCFLGLYENPQVFGMEEAKLKQQAIDWLLVRNGSNAQPMSLHAYAAGDSYYNNSKYYLQGFTELSYLFLSAKRGKITKAEFDKIESEYDLQAYLDHRIIGPNPEGENYNIAKASRRVGDNFNITDKKDGGFVIGWGDHTHPTTSPTIVNNHSFAIVWVNKVTMLTNGHLELELDIRYPVENQRALHNTSNIAPYGKYPL